MAIAKKYTLIFFTLSFISHFSYASAVFFKCDFKNNKEVVLSRDGNDIYYIFGKKNSSPDIILKEKKERLDINFEDLSGRYLTNSLTIHNYSYSYRLITSVDRIADIQEPETSLTVLKNGEELTSLRCLKGSEVGALISIND